MKALIVCLFASLSLGLSAQEDIILRVEINADTILYGNPIEIKYTAENAQGIFEAPEFTDFFIVGGPNSSSQFSMVNGVVSQRASYSYLLEPKREGNLIIESATFKTDLQSYTTDGVDIYVLPNPNGIRESYTNPRIRESRLQNLKPKTKQDSMSIIRKKLSKIKTKKV